MHAEVSNNGAWVRMPREVYDGSDFWAVARHDTEEGISITITKQVNYTLVLDAQVNKNHLEGERATLMHWRKVAKERVPMEHDQDLVRQHHENIDKFSNRIEEIDAILEGHAQALIDNPLKEWTFKLEEF